MISVYLKPTFLFLCLLLADTTILVGQSLQPRYSVFLIGDAGEPSVINSPQINLLKSQLQQAGGNSTVIFLGDNIYPKGMPSYDDPYRETAEEIIMGQLSITKNTAGRVFIIPGNHDWEKGKKNGVYTNYFQEEFVENYMDSVNVYVPDKGCPGPVEIPLTNDLVLIIIDTQWILHPWGKPRKEQGCQAQTPYDVLTLTEDILRRNEGKKIIVASHHPMFSYGIHGGVTTLKNHLFPLTDVSDNLYIPLPVVGSLYPFYRKYIGSLQDIANPLYETFRDKLVELFERYPDLIHVAGHEHNLQYSYKDSIHYIVSGAGSKHTHVKLKGYSEFVKETIGFARLDFFDDGKVEVSFWDADGSMLFQKQLMKKIYKPPVLISEFVKTTHFEDSVVTTVASRQYIVKPSKYWLVGANYRDVWAAPVKVPVFDIGKVKGGLTILKRGGGMQTKSLRLENPDGKQYVIRSIEKYVEKIIPDIFRETFAADLVQDQISSSNPYGAFVVPRLAEAAGIYHTNPQLYFIPDDPRFGLYRYDFANTLVLFEERPAGNRKDIDSFGNSKNIYNTADLLEQLYKDNDNNVDQHWVLKSRLFDFFIGDWDRHDDQWRWASFKNKKGKGKLFRPIPRDRDQAFFVSEGLVMSIAKRKWAIPKFQGFDDNLKNPAGYMFNARYFDRDFLSEMDAEDWRTAVHELQQNMTDEVIEDAISTWEQPVYTLVGEEVISILKVRRAKLDEWTLDYYRFLSEYVNVRGSFKKEYFRVDRLDDLKTRVRVYKMTDKKKKSKLIYDRTFIRGETKEIRLYGLKGDDEFRISGNVNKGIKIRVIGGPGKDIITDSSKVKGLLKKTIVYDTRVNTDLMLGKESRNKTSNDPLVNLYNRNDFKYNFTAPLVFLNYNVDDKLFLGGGFIATTHGFRKTPFKSRHFLLGSIAPVTYSFVFTYLSTYTDVIKKLDLQINLIARSPNFTSNFFGLGNNSEFDQNIAENKNVKTSIDYYRVRFQQYSAEILLSKQLGTKANMHFGAHWQAFETEDDYNGEDRFILDYAEATGDFTIFGWKTYQGLVFKLDLDTRDNRVIPERGMVWNLDLRGYVGLNTASNKFTRFQSGASFYYTFRLPSKLTLAAHIEGGHNFGTYEYYQGQILSGPLHLRGYRKTRFIGDSRAFSNLEVRYHLARIRSRVVPMKVGLTGFYDIGRVWLEGENSNSLHRGYGGGLWLAPYGATVVAFDIAGSEEGTSFYIRLGFLF